MSELIEFLLARIAEDEEAAGDWATTEDGWGCLECNNSSGGVDAFDSTRVLAECAAKRAIVEACTMPGRTKRRPTAVRGRYDVYETRVPIGAGFDGGVDGEDVLRLLARPYRGAEGWRDEWAL